MSRDLEVTILEKMLPKGLAVAEIIVAAQLSSRRAAVTLLHRMAKAGEIERAISGVVLEDICEMISI